MGYSGIGGQAVMEGVMMKNKNRYAVAVRKPDCQIEVMTKEYNGIIAHKWWEKVPMLRGVISFIDSLVLGISTLMYSSTFFDDEEENETDKSGGSRQDGENEKSNISSGEKEISAKEKALMGGTVAFSLVIAVVVFMLLPYFLSQLFQSRVDNGALTAIFEGVLRLIIFLVYIIMISRMKEIQRVFMYHGAEHKCINCIESGLDLNVENVRKSSKEHKRCGTSFLMFVVIISIILFLFIRVDSHVMRIVIRLILVPVIAGISYELLRAAGRSDNALINIVSRPGLWLQGLTTKEPDDDMIEVGIASVEAVFDWKEYVGNLRKEQEK